MLRNTNQYDDIPAGKVMQNRAVALGDYGEIPLITTGDSTFLKHPWLLKVTTKMHVIKVKNVLIRSCAFHWW